MPELTGYLHPAYADSFRAWGRPQLLPRCGGWIVRRDVADVGVEDAMGCYPLFACQDWRRLRADVEALDGDLVALSLVADPFGRYDVVDLKTAFPDLCRPYKAHFVVNLRTAAALPGSAHHRRHLRRAQRLVEVEESANPAEHAGEWLRLYDNLVARHEITGVPAFSAATLSAQLHVPGLTMLRATRGGVVVGITLWYTQGEVVYYHLGAYSDEGYASSASFALFQFAITHFRSRASWLNLGGGAGASPDPADGLTRFKKGWATGTRTAWLCGRVLDRLKYAALTRQQSRGSGFFPLYRDGQFR